MKLYFPISGIPHPQSSPTHTHSPVHLCFFSQSQCSSPTVYLFHSLSPSWLRLPIIISPPPPSPHTYHLPISAPLYISPPTAIYTSIFFLNPLIPNAGSQPKTYTLCLSRCCLTTEFFCCSVFIVPVSNICCFFHLPTISISIDQSRAAFNRKCVSPHSNRQL